MTLAGYPHDWIGDSSSGTWFVLTCLPESPSVLSREGSRTEWVLQNEYYTSNLAPKTNPKLVLRVQDLNNDYEYELAMPNQIFGQIKPDKWRLDLRLGVMPTRNNAPRRP
jgi:hypothetical protein